VTFHGNPSSDNHADMCEQVDGCMDRHDEGDRHMLRVCRCLKMNQMLCVTWLFLNELYELCCFTLHCMGGGSQNSS
jgi:hypothetical protein